MTSVRHQALILLSTLALSGLSSQTLAATASATSKEAGSAPPNAREKMLRLAQASDVATEELRGGFNKLKRLCEYTAGAKPSQPESAKGDAFISLQTRSDLREVKISLDRILVDYKKNSHVTQSAGCKYLPAFFARSGTCQRFQKDSERLADAELLAGQASRQALERLELYDQYWQLERQGCTRPGFALKLWSIEDRNLWPLLLNAPNTLKSMLPSAAENE